MYNRNSRTAMWDKKLSEELASMRDILPVPVNETGISKFTWTNIKGNVKLYNRLIDPTSDTRFPLPIREVTSVTIQNVGSTHVYSFSDSGKRFREWVPSGCSIGSVKDPPATASGMVSDTFINIEVYAIVPPGSFLEKYLDIPKNAKDEDRLFKGSCHLTDADFNRDSRNSSNSLGSRASNSVWVAELGEIFSVDPNTNSYLTGDYQAQKARVVLKSSEIIEVDKRSPINAFISDKSNIDKNQLYVSYDGETILILPLIKLSCINEGEVLIRTASIPKGEDKEKYVYEEYSEQELLNPTLLANLPNCAMCLNAAALREWSLVHPLREKRFSFSDNGKTKDELAKELEEALSENAKLQETINTLEDRLTTEKENNRSRTAKAKEFYDAYNKNAEPPLKELITFLASFSGNVPSDEIYQKREDAKRKREEEEAKARRAEEVHKTSKVKTKLQLWTDVIKTVVLTVDFVKTFWPIVKPLFNRGSVHMFA